MKSHTFLISLASVLVLLTGCSSSSHDMSKLKEELKQEILAELRRQGKISNHDLSQKIPEPAREEAHQPVKVETEHVVRAGDESPVQPAANTSAPAFGNPPPVRSSAVGRAAGYILRDGKGLEGCEVRLVRMLRGLNANEILVAASKGTAFMTTTDAQGRYAFNELPVGSYKLKWQLPGDKSWIRRLRDEPDAVVGEGQTIIVKPVEANRRLAGY